MIIKNYNNFMTERKSGTLYDYGCVMLYPEIDDWKDIISKIDDKDVYSPKGDSTFGIEKSPHITLLYGLHFDVTDDDVKKAINKFKNKEIKISLNGISSFKNKDFDVVKINVEGDIIYDINKELCKLPYTTDYPDYQPHMTIAYVKKGKSTKYESKYFKMDLGKINKIVYSATSGDEFVYHL